MFGIIFVMFYIIVKGVEVVISFYCDVFGVSEVFCMIDFVDGCIGYVEFCFGLMIVMLVDEYLDFGVVGLDMIGGMLVMFYFVIDSVDVDFE